MKRVISANYDSIPHFSIKKEGKYMTRIACAASDTLLSISSDSQYTHTNGEKSYNHQKIFHNNSVVICLAGTMTLDTSDGIIDLTEIIKEELAINDDFFTIIDNLISIIGTIFERYHYIGFSHLLCFMIKNQQIYCFPFEINMYPHHFGTYHIIYPFGKMTCNNRSKFLFHQSFIHVGEGIDSPNILHFEGHPQSLTEKTIYNDIKNPSLEAVGGNIQTLTIDINRNIKTYTSDINNNSV